MYLLLLIIIIIIIYFFFMKINNEVEPFLINFEINLPIFDKVYYYYYYYYYM